MGFFKVARMFLCDAGQKLTFRHFQTLCMVIVAAVIASLTNASRPRMDSGHFYAMLHIGSFASCIGAQLWVILVAGMTMFFILPRHQFGRLQTFLFPMFFLWCLTSSGVALATFSPHSSPHTGSHQHAEYKTYWIQMTCLSISFLAAALNSIVLAPLIVGSMVKTFQFEVEVGAGHIVGHAVIDELTHNPEYVRTYGLFRRYHSRSALLNVTSLLANFVYLHYLTSRLVV